jgi:competence protein ComEA
LPRLFYFDPNTLSQKGWEELGLRPRTIKTIQNYIAKGGRFYKPEDLERIYGLSEEVYQRLYPFIRIESINAPVTSKEPRPVSISKESRYTVIDINAADTTAFISLPGIGSRLATRIINFRERLGGFYAIEQIAEVYGLADSVFQKIKNYLRLETNSIIKININTASLEELKAHPYIRHAIAAPLVAYRNEHGLFVRIEDIKKVMAVTNEVYEKIAPYLIL